MLVVVVACVVGVVVMDWAVASNCFKHADSSIGRTAAVTVGGKTCFVFQWLAELREGMFWGGAIVAGFAIAIEAAYKAMDSVSE